MPRTESIQAAREAKANLEARIVEAIQKVGPKNISLLSRVTGAHAETIRYKVKRQFPALGLQLKAGPDYGKLGLADHWGMLKFSARGERFAQSILLGLRQQSYLTYYGRIVPQGHYAVHFALPDGLVKAQKEILEHLTGAGVLDGFELKEVAAGRLNPMNSRYFNFQSDSWEVDWAKVRAESGRPLPATKQSPLRVDELDLLLVKETEENPLQHIVAVARKLRVHQKTLEYHYRAHVLRQKLVPSFVVRWNPGPQDTEEGPVMLGSLMFSRLGPRFDEVQRAVSKIPFTWAECAFKDGRYLATLCIPVNEAVTVFSYLDSELGDLSDKVEIGYVKRSEQRVFSVPAHLFDGRWGIDTDAAKQKLAKLARK